MNKSQLLNKLKFIKSRIDQDTHLGKRSLDKLIDDIDKIPVSVETVPKANMLTKDEIKLLQHIILDSHYSPTLVWADKKLTKQLEVLNDR